MFTSSHLPYMNFSIGLKSRKGSIPANSEVLLRINGRLSSPRRKHRRISKLLNNSTKSLMFRSGSFYLVRGFLKLKIQFLWMLGEHEVVIDYSESQSRIRTRTLSDKISIPKR
jgi:hypothetical protein